MAKVYLVINFKLVIFFFCFAAFEVPMAIHLKNDPLSCQIFYAGSSHGITAEFHQRSYPPLFMDLLITLAGLVLGLSLAQIWMKI
jgi:hypothetical protein